MWELELIVLKNEMIEDIGAVSNLFPDRPQPGSQLGPKYQMNQSRAKKERSTEVQRALLGRFVQIFPSKIDARARSISIPIIPT